MMIDLAALVEREAARLPANARAAPIIVAVSGGADSIALLHALGRWAGANSARLYAVHVDHGLRDAVSRADDLALVMALCLKVGVPLRVERVDVASSRVGGAASGENAARDARYRALAGVANRERAGTIALGHHADDQVETVLLHLLRGSGTAGLRGMRPLRVASLVASAGVSAPLLWRPFLGLRHAELVAYCVEHQLVYSHDATNVDERFTRNHVRHTVLPALAQAVTGASASLARAADILAAEDDLLEQVTETAWERVAIRWPGYIAIVRDALRREHLALQRRLVRRAWQELTGDFGGFMWRHTESVRLQLVGTTTGGHLDLPGGHQLIVDRHSGYVGSRATLATALQTAFAAPLVPRAWSQRIDPRHAAAIDLPDDHYRVSLTALLTGSQEQGLVLSVPRSSLEALWLRTRLPGDVVTLPDGRHRALQDWLVDRHVPSYVRDGVLLLTQGSSVFWIAGVAAFMPPPSVPDVPASPPMTLMLWYDGRPVAPIRQDDR